jgi:hypothetical protein
MLNFDDVSILSGASVRRLKERAAVLAKQGLIRPNYADGLTLQDATFMASAVSTASVSRLIDTVNRLSTMTLSEYVAHQARLMRAVEEAQQSRPASADRARPAK